ncbi:hypothetical protein Rhopal_005283-T1 [Rhodotorula paludigena]|uniref:Uncharacterized protein n=1 Tax=Rhodotorula paludigena TaxID=86838 RepID=A0AAV5GQ06_9BASI|nr:hypothetical protein Rhopal_005283-T1 [Rhodotorula paludigena]
MPEGLVLEAMRSTLAGLTYNAARFAPAVRPAVLAPSSTLLAFRPPTILAPSSTLVAFRPPAVLAPSWTVLAVRPLHSLASDKDGSAHQPAAVKSASIAPTGTRQYASGAPPAPNPNRLHADTSGAKSTTFWWPSSDTAWRDRKTGFKEISYVYTWPTVLALLCLGQLERAERYAMQVCVLGAITAYYYGTSPP